MARSAGKSPRIRVTSAQLNAARARDPRQKWRLAEIEIAHGSGRGGGVSWRVSRHVGVPPGSVVNQTEMPAHTVSALGIAAISSRTRSAALRNVGSPVTSATAAWIVATE